MIKYKIKLIYLHCQQETNNVMAKIGYIFNAAHQEGLDCDRAWMKEYGCIQIIEEATDHEALRPQWKQLMANLDRGDELVISKFSNAVRGSRELSTLIEYCRVKVVRIVSINDKIDSKGILFPETTAAQVLEIVGALPEEVIALRRASAHQIQLQKSIKVPNSIQGQSRDEREKTIVAMYNNGHSIDDIWNISGFRSKSSVFRILNKYGVKLNRGKFSGPLGKRKSKEEPSEE